MAKANHFVFWILAFLGLDFSCNGLGINVTAREKRQSEAEDDDDEVG